MLGFYGTGENEQLRAAANLRRQTILLPPSAPDRSRLALIDFSVIVDEDGEIGILLVYDDPRTKREVDYLELYSMLGDLLSASWIDRFGICRVAMDRGLLNKDDPYLERVFVLVPTAGISV